MSKKEIKVSAPRASDVDPKQAVAPDPDGPVMTYEERRAAIRAVFPTHDEEGTPVRSEEESERLIDACLAREHLPGPVPEGKLFTVQAFGKDGQPLPFEEGGGGLPLTHEEAISVAKDQNEKERTDGRWYGVTHVAIEAK